MAEPATQADSASSLPGINVMLMGPPGTGKTHAIRTLADAGLEVFVLFTEPGMEVLGDTDPDQVHWHYVSPATADWATMLKNAQSANRLDAAALQKMPGLNKQAYTQLFQLLGQCQNFTCERTGKEFGDVATWDNSRVFVLDSLSGLNTMALDLVTGAKPLKTLPDWGMAIDHEERILNTLCLSTSCHFVLTAHIDRYTDEVLGGVKHMPAALGKKLPNALGRFFSDVIMCKREGDKFSWNVAESTADVKARNLPWKDKQPPTFLPLINNWRTKR